MIRKKTRVPTLAIIILYSSESASHGAQRRKKNKKNPDWKTIKTLNDCR